MGKRNSVERQSTACGKLGELYAHALLNGLPPTLIRDLTMIHMYRYHRLMTRYIFNSKDFSGADFSQVGLNGEGI
jgi:hypothetical protein